MQPGGCQMIFFALVWGAFTLVFDGLVGHTVWQRLEARRFATTPGRVTRSELLTARGGKGATYQAKVFFAYAVDGQSYTGDRYHFGEMFTSNRRGSAAVVAAHPAGREVTVYYDKAKPAMAVLRVGLEGDELFLGLFMVPFNCVMLGGGAAAWNSLRGRFSRKEPRAPEPGERARSRELQLISIPLRRLLTAAGGTGFALVFLIGFPTGFNPGLVTVGAGWGAVLLAAVLGFMWGRKRVRRRSQC